MRAKTIKRLAILLAVLGVIGGAGYCGWGYQIERMGKLELEKARLAEKAGKPAEAERIYRQYLGVIPTNTQVKLTYADLLLKGDTSTKRRREAYQLYSSILKSSQTWNEDAQRQLMKLKMDMGIFTSTVKHLQLIEGADLDLDILLKRRPEDGDLLFRRGRCYEEGGDWKNAVNNYDLAIKHLAIKHNAPQRIEAYQRRATLLEAYQRRATLLRDRIKPPQLKEADQAIKTMVQSDPENYRAYVARGQYYLSDPDKSKHIVNRQVARDNFQKALKLAPGEPEIYVLLAMTFEEEGKSDIDNVRQILAEGLKKAPRSTRLYALLAEMQLRAGRVDEAMKTLEDGVRKVPQPADLRFLLAELLAGQRANSKLDAQIVELRKLDVSKGCLDYLSGLYYINNNEFAKARRYLLPLQGGSELPPGYKSRVNNRLAQCSEQLGEPERAQQYYRQALIDNPQNPAARLALIPYLGTEEAIKEYRALLSEIPAVRLDLASLLIGRNRRMSQSQRDWNEPERLINEATKATPDSVDPILLRAEFLLAQGKATEALNELKQAHARFPKSVDLWTAQARLLEQQGRIDEALSLLEQARGQVGDQVGLRLSLALLWAKKGGPQVLKVWHDLAQDADSFSKEDRRKLLRGLAVISRQQDPSGAGLLWSRLAEEDPDNINIRLDLFDLALGVGSNDDIKKSIQQIRRIEGSEGLLGRYCEALDVIRQARQQTDKKKREELQTSARVLLNELLSRRRDWSRLPMAFAELEEQELLQDSSLTEKERKAKEESAVNYYLQAISLGQRQPALVHRAVQLLFKNDRGNTAVELLKSLPAELRVAADLGRLAGEFAIEKDFNRAAQIARIAVADNPGNLQEWLQLVQTLLNANRRTEAEAELRKAVDLSKSDSRVWIALVEFLVFTRQPVKAEQAIRDAAANLPQAPLALAQCCELVGGSYERWNPGEAMKKWYAEAKKWYEKALAADPDNLSIKRLLTEFFLKTKQISEAKSQLDAILKQGAGARTSDIVAWANRTRALIAAEDRRPQEARKALSYFEGKTKNPEDLRILARVLDLQKTPEHRKQAIEILESLTEKKPANSEDQLLLARLYEINRDWPKARAKYQELYSQTKSPRDLQTLDRRPVYLAAFAQSLIRHLRPGEKQELTQAQELVDEIKQLQPDALTTLYLQVELDLANNRSESAAARIQAYAGGPQPSPQVLETLANLAEVKLGSSGLTLAEKLYRQVAALPAVPQGKIELAKFLGRHDRSKDALDVLEPLWSNTDAIDGVVTACIDVLLSNQRDPDPVQLNRSCGWFEQALKQKPGSILLSIGLANLREHQDRYQEAEELYRSVIKLGDGNRAPGDSRTISTSYNNLAWLMGLYDRKGQEALPYVNHAIKVEGPLPDFLDTRGILYLTVADIQHAIDDLEKAVADAPTPSKYFHLTQAYLAAKNKEKATQSWKAANKTKGWEQGGLHPLEKEAYRQVLKELGAP
jgi:tetratricopeptide (TPR) repeat protein